MTMPEKKIREIRKRLLAWYGEEARDLPWRSTQDPYAILVSEIMLQQTRVETVLSYYERFLKRFPTFVALAHAPIDDVLKAWEGLGYYRRAHNLHRAAQAVVEKHSGHLPASRDALGDLPGIGAYTAGAVASIAFNLNEPALDGNIIRVLSRVFAVDSDISRAATKRTLLEFAARLVRDGSASEMNQGLMDLGARVCLPRRPQCEACPVASECDAHHLHHETRFPKRRPRKPIPHRDIVAGIIWSQAPFSPDARILIAQRKRDDMLGGLWEFPGGHVEEGETFEDALARELEEELGISVSEIVPFMTVKHTYTHFRMSLHVYHCQHTGGTPQTIDCADWHWVFPGEFDNYAFPTADRKILDAIKDRALR